jgi:hypothetical protein
MENHPCSSGDSGYRTSLPDADFAKPYGISPTDHEAMSAARANRTMWENRQARVCELSDDCRVDRIPTAEHYVQNASPERAAGIITALAQQRISLVLHDSPFQ